MSDLKLDVDQAGELKAMFRRERGSGGTSWTNELIKVLCERKGLGGELLDVLLGNAEIKRLEFWCVLNDLGIQIPALKQPTLKELRKQFSWIERVERDTSPTEAVTLRLGTVLRTNENYIAGPEYERRLASRKGFVLGYQQAAWLVEHQDEFPALRALLGKVYINFPGIIVVDAGGDRDLPCLIRDGERWDLHWDWTGGRLGRGGRVASK